MTPNQIKKLAVDAVRASGEYCQMYQGKVTSVEPLSIVRTDGVVLVNDMLILTSAVTDHYVDVEFNCKTTDTLVNESGGVIDLSHIHIVNIGSGGFPTDDATQESGAPKPIDGSHYHEVVGKKTMKVYNGLKKDEWVVLVKVLWGQHFIVLDRLKNTNCLSVDGEWLSERVSNAPKLVEGVDETKV